MATRKKIAPVEAEEKKPSIEKQVQAWATPGTVSPNGYILKRIPRIELVDCSEFFPELPDLKAGVDVNVAVRVRDGVDIPGATPLEQALRRQSLLFPVFEGWNFADDITQQPIPCPDPADIETYRPLTMRISPLSEFGGWLNAVAVNRAIIQSMGNLQARLTKAEPTTEQGRSEIAPNKNA